MFKLSKYVMCLWLPVLWCAGSNAQPYVTYGGNWQDYPNRIHVIDNQVLVVGHSATGSSTSVFNGFVLVASLYLDSVFFKYHVDTVETVFNNSIEKREGGFFVCGNTTNHCCGELTDAILMKLTEDFQVDTVYKFGGEFGENFLKSLRLGEHLYLFGYTSSYTTETSGTNSVDPYVVKCKMDGTVLWEKHPGTTQFDQFYNAVLSVDQSYFYGVGGSTSTGDFNDGYVIKLDTAGNVVWRKLYKSAPQRVEFFNAVTVASDGGLAAGHATPNGSGIQGPYFVRFDENGDTLWTKLFYRFNEPSTSPHNIRWKNSEVWDAATLSDGTFVVSGNWYNEEHEDQDIFIYKFDQDGDSLWRIDLGSQYGHDKGWAIATHEDFIYAACSYDNPNLTNGTRDVLLIKLDANGCTVDTCLVSVPPALQSSTKPFTLYPNPTDNIIRVQLDASLFHSGELIISDASGRQVLHQAVSNNASVSVHTLPQGIYIAEMRLKNGERYFQRFVRQ